jgi:spore germination protein GerM
MLQFEYNVHEKYVYKFVKFGESVAVDDPVDDDEKLHLHCNQDVSCQVIRGGDILRFEVAVAERQNHEISFENVATTPETPKSREMQLNSETVNDDCDKKLRSYWLAARTPWSHCLY